MLNHLLRMSQQNQGQSKTVLILIEQPDGKPAGGLFRKKESSGVKAYMDGLDASCYICSRMAGMFERYLVTVFYLYEHDEEFRRKFSACKGFCNPSAAAQTALLYLLYFLNCGMYGKAYFLSAA